LLSFGLGFGFGLEAQGLGLGLAMPGLGLVHCGIVNQDSNPRKISLSEPQ